MNNFFEQIALRPILLLRWTAYILSAIALIAAKKTHREKERPCCFAYACAVPQEMAVEIVQTAVQANGCFRLKERQNHSSCVQQLQQKASAIAGGAPLPASLTDNADAALLMGARFGYALAMAYGWKWMLVGTDAARAEIAVVSPKENYCLLPQVHLYRILQGNAENDLQQLFARCAKADRRQLKHRLTPLFPEEHS